MTITELFYAHQGRLADKWDFYLPLYQRHLEKYVGTECTILEIGVCHGGSLQLWKKWFGPKATIIGIDIDSRCALYEEDQISVIIGDQGKESFWNSLDIRPDICIDDGSHQFADQTTSLRCLWHKIKPNGTYWIEDCHHERPEAPRDAGAICLYPWVSVFEKTSVKPRRIVSGYPSRELNDNEIEAYREFLGEV